MLAFDLESDGLDPAKARIVQFAFVPSDGEPLTGLVNPGRPIPPDATAVHGITDEMVADAPTFKMAAQRIADLIRGKTLVGFGCHHFDVPLLAEEFERAGVDYQFGPVIDVGALFKRHHPRNLLAAVKTYLGDERARLFEGVAHNAEQDAFATADVYHQLALQFDPSGQGDGCLATKPDAEAASLSAYGKTFADPAGKLVVIDGRVCFNTLRNQGVPVVNDEGYAQWMLRQDFPLATKRVIERVLEEMWQTPSLFPEENQ